MNGWICGCIVGIIAACIVVPPVGWGMVAVVGTVVAFTGDATRG